jgi:chaperonin GroEL
MKRKTRQKQPRFQTPRVVFQPTVSRGMQGGINQMIDLIRPTLGPHPRTVALERATSRARTPEVLDDGGTIARRILALPDREEDVGAMYIRHVLWKLHEKVGDGTATAAVVFREIYNEGLRCIAAGSNAMRLRHFLYEGMDVVIGELTGMATQLEGKEALAQLAETLCHDPELARLLGEIFDIIGAYGRVEIRKGQTRELKREYVEGMYWEEGALSRRMYIDQEALTARLENPAVLITDLDIEDPRDLMPVLALAIEANLGSLLIVARKIGDSGLSLLASPRAQERLKMLAVKTPSPPGDAQAAVMQDLVMLAGGRFFTKATGDSIRRVKLEDLGRVRSAWATRFRWGIAGGQGDPRRLREHLANLRSAFERDTDSKTRKALQERIGKLMGGSALLYIGALTEMDLEARKELAQRTADAMRAAMRDGVVPGGGVALLSCCPALRERLEQSTELEERAAYRILLRGMEAPIRTIVGNAGFDPSVVMSEVGQAGPGHGFDVVNGQVVRMAEAGIYDAAAVHKSAVHSAVGGAALALTTDVVVHRARPPQEYGT